MMLTGPGVIVSPLDGEGEEEETIVVTGIREAGSGGPSFSLFDFQFGIHFGEGTSNGNPFFVSAGWSSLPAHDMVGRSLESLALALKTVVDLARPVLPKSQEVRLDALVDTLQASAIGLKAGNLSLANARALVESSLAVSLDLLSGSGLGVLFGGMGAWASTFAPHPGLKAFSILGSGAAGLALDWYISDTGTAQSVAKFLTDSLFNGAEAFADGLNTFFDMLMSGINPITGSYDPFQGASYMELQSNGQFGEFDGYTGNGPEYAVDVHHYGLGTSYLFSTNPVLYVPPGWNGGSGDVPPVVVDPFSGAHAPVDSSMRGQELLQLGQPVVQISVAMIAESSFLLP